MATIRPKVSDYYLGPGRVEAFQFSEDGICAMAVQPDLSRCGRRAREIEAWGYWVRPPVGGRKFCVRPRNLAEIDEVSVKAQKRFVESMEPEWISRVKNEWETYRDEESTIFWSELPAETVRAILTILRERGELPEG
jgi:hypothetical protein